jgi:hypothetical protein
VVPPSSSRAPPPPLGAKHAPGKKFSTSPRPEIRPPCYLLLPRIKSNKSTRNMGIQPVPSSSSGGGVPCMHALSLWQIRFRSVPIGVPLCEGGRPTTSSSARCSPSFLCGALQQRSGCVLGFPGRVFFRARLAINFPLSSLHSAPYQEGS